MLKPDNIEHLKRALFTNRVVLFLGAGFSCSAESEAGVNIPSGEELSQVLWRFCYEDDQYEKTDLQTIFDVALKSNKGIEKLKYLLQTYLRSKSKPDWYSLVSSQYWYRIYTTNIDDLIETIYKKPRLPVKLDKLVAQVDEFKERDQFLNSIQYIKLNGSIENNPQTHTFSARQFAKRSTDFDIWYDHFVRDYMTHITIFIGTNLNEPLFWRHIEFREKRLRGTPERRPRSYLVCPRIARPKKDTLYDSNIIPIESNAEDFLKWLDDTIPTPTSQEEVLRASHPNLAHIFQHREEGLDRSAIEKLENFYRNFEIVTTEQPSQSHRRKSYLLGKSPQWQDLYHNLDAWRDINEKFIGEVESCIPSDEELQVVALLGSAGSGKSTILMRTALYFCAKGFPCFFSISEELLKPEDFVTAVEKINQRLFVFMDDTDFALRWLARVVEISKDLQKKPIFIIVSRINRYERLAGNLLKVVKVKEMQTPDLSDNDIEGIINKLSEENLLGRLRGKHYNEQFKEFKVRARKQILVAMREATEGKDFDEIIKSEYEEISPIDARYLYLSIALASAERYKLSIQQILATYDGDASIIYNYLERNLKGLIIKPYEHDDYYEARHPIIAGYTVESVAERSHLKEAYVRLLAVLAHDKGPKTHYNSRVNRLFRRLINHWAIYKRFHDEIEFARDIFESVKGYLNNDFHFWLQYGSLELEYGVLSYAANYLAQAEALRPYDNLILTSKAHLKYRQSKEANDFHNGNLFREEGKELILDQINLRADYSPHPFHVFGSQELSYVRRWQEYIEDDEYVNILKTASDVVESGRTIHYRSRDLAQLSNDLKRELLSTAIPPNTPVNF